MLLYLYPFRMTPQKLVATDLVHATPLAVAVVAGTGYLLAVMVDWPMLLSLLVGSIPTVWLGSKLSARMSGRWLQVALVGVLMVAGGKVLL